MKLVYKKIDDLGLGWVIEDDLQITCKEKLLASGYRSLEKIQVLLLFGFYSSSGQLGTLIFKHTGACAPGLSTFLANTVSKKV